MLWTLKKKIKEGRDDDKIYDLVLYWSGRQEMIRQLRKWGMNATRQKEVEKLVEDLYSRPSPLETGRCKKCERREKKRLALEKNLRDAEPPGVVQDFPRPPEASWVPPSLTWD